MGYINGMGCVLLPHVVRNTQPMPLDIVIYHIPCVCVCVCVCVTSVQEGLVGDVRLMFGATGTDSRRSKAAYHDRGTPIGMAPTTLSLSMIDRLIRLISLATR
jgi:hypothetical protein